MSYTKQTWNTGDTITAQKLNHMEDGIGGKEEFALIVTYDELKNPLLSATGPSLSEMNALISENKLDVRLGEPDNGWRYPQCISGGDSIFTFDICASPTTLYQLELTKEGSDLSAFYAWGDPETLSEREYTVVYDSATKTYTFTPTT